MFSTKEQRAKLIAEAPAGSIVLVGHTHAGRYDHEVLANSHEWGSVGIDEPQELRSRSGSGRLSAGAKRIFKIQAKNRHALTATPATEQAGEVYDIVNWARPKVLGFRTRFQGAFDGFGVTTGLAGCSSGASSVTDQTISTTLRTIMQISSM